MITKWTSHLQNKKEKEDFEKEVRSSRKVLDRMKTIVDEYEKELNAVETTTAQYDSPSWDYRQADNNGYRRCLNQIRRLVDLDQRILRPND